MAAGIASNLRAGWKPDSGTPAEFQATFLAQERRPANIAGVTIMSSVCRVLSFMAFCQGKLHVRKEIACLSVRHAFISLHASPRRVVLFSLEPETAINGTEQVGLAVTG